MLIKRIFCLFLGSTILSPVYGMEPIDAKENKRIQRPAPNYPIKLTGEELFQIFGLSKAENDLPWDGFIGKTEASKVNNKVKIANDFWISHKATPVQALKIKAFFLRTKDSQVSAVGVMGAEPSYTLGDKYENSTAIYKLYKDGKRVCNYNFQTSFSRPIPDKDSPQTISEISIKKPKGIKPSKKSPKKTAPSKHEAPRGCDQENHYLDFVVDLFLVNKLPKNLNSTNSELAELLVYSYPAFTTEKNLFSLLNIFKEEFPDGHSEEEYLQKLTSFLQILKSKGLPNGRENFLKAVNEFEALTKILDMPNPKDDYPTRWQYISQFNTDVQKLKEELLNITKEESTKNKDRHYIFNLIKSKKFSPIDGMNLKTESFMNELLKRDLFLCPKSLSDIANIDSDLWQTIENQSTQTSSWFALQFLSLPQKKDREELCQKLGELFSSLLKRGNYHGAGQVAMGLMANNAVRRVIEADEIIHPILTTMATFIDGLNRFKIYREQLASDVESNSPYFPSYVVLKEDIHKNIEQFSLYCAGENDWDLTNPKHIQKRQESLERSIEQRFSLIKMMANLLKTHSSYHVSLSSSSDKTYLEALCSFNIHSETLEVYSHLLHEWTRSSKEWSQLDPKTLEDWTPGYFAYLLQTKGYQHAIAACFDQDVCDGQAISNVIDGAGDKEKALMMLGGRRGLSKEIVDFILNTPRKNEEVLQSIKSTKRKDEEKIPLTKSTSKKASPRKSVPKTTTESDLITITPEAEKRLKSFAVDSKF